MSIGENIIEVDDSLFFVFKASKKIFFFLLIK